MNYAQIFASKLDRDIHDLNYFFSIFSSSFLSLSLSNEFFSSFFLLHLSVLQFMLKTI